MAKTEERRQAQRGPAVNHTIRGSDVFVKEDLRAQLDALALAAGGYAAGEFRSGFLAALAAVRASIGLPAGGALECVHEALELHFERTTMRQSAPPAASERRFRIQGHTEEQDAALVAPPAAPATQRRPAVDMSGDDVSITVFNPKRGELRQRSEGFVWVPFDGSAASFWHAADWQQIPEAEALEWGELLPEHWLMLVRHAYAERKRAEAAGRVRVLGRERGLLR